MHTAEINELKRTMNKKNCAMSRFVVGYVNMSAEIVSISDVSTGLLSDEDQEAYVSRFKKCLSGSSGKNLIDINYETAQVTNNAHHALLMKIRDSELQDTDAVKELFQQIAKGYATDNCYAIFLTHNTYDVPYKRREGVLDHGIYNNVYSYISCAICPVKQSKPTLSFDSAANEFRVQPGTPCAGLPNYGFIFPAFDDRTTNIYAGLYYTKSGEVDECLLGAIFDTSIPMSVDEQKEAFANALISLGDDCNLDVVKTIRDDMIAKEDEFKETQSLACLSVTSDDIAQSMEACSVPDNKIEAFARTFEHVLGRQKNLLSRNLLDLKKCEMKIPDAGVVIKTSSNAEKPVEVKVDMYNGRKCVILPVVGEILYNGVPVKI